MHDPHGLHSLWPHLKAAWAWSVLQPAHDVTTPRPNHSNPGQTLAPQTLHGQIQVCLASPLQIWLAQLAPCSQVYIPVSPFPKYRTFTHCALLRDVSKNGPRATEEPVNLLEMHFLQPTPDLWTQISEGGSKQSVSPSPSRWFWRALREPMARRSEKWILRYSLINQKLTKKNQIVD